MFLWIVNPLSAHFTKWSNTLKQFVGNLATNCLSLFDHFVGLALKVFETQIVFFSVAQERPEIWEGVNLLQNEPFRGCYWMGNRRAGIRLISVHGDIILNRSNNSVFLHFKIYWKQQTFDLSHASRILMKPETLRHQSSSLKFQFLYFKALI